MSAAAVLAVAASPIPRPPAEPLRLVWAAVTIRVAWELHRAGLKPTTAVLRDARDHALLSLPAQVNREQAEELATYFTRELIDRVRHGRYRRRPPDREPLRMRPSWRVRLLEILDPVGEVVLRQCYGDGLNVEAVESLTGVDRVVLRSARAGVRDAMRLLIAEDGEAEGPIDEATLDRVLERVARQPAASCRGGVEVTTAEGRAHAEDCPRCARAIRLMRAGLLSPSDLTYPEDRRPPEQCSVLVLHLHPEARHFRRLLCEHFEGACFRADDDALLIDLDRVENHVGVLYMLAEESTPIRDHIRGAMVRGPGRWTKAGLLGPVASAGVELTRARPWGEVDGVGTLPEPLPEPPSAARWWSAALLFTLLAIAVGLFTLRPERVEPSYPVHAELRSRGEQQVVRFDTQDFAYVLAVAQTAEGLQVLHNSENAWDKGQFATGQGDYEIDPAGGRLLIATSASPFADLDALLRAAGAAPSPLTDLANRLPANSPDVDVWIQPRAP